MTADGTTDLRYQDLSGRVMFGEDLRGAKLYGAKVSLTCEQFDGLYLDDQQVALLVLMLCEARFSPSLRDQLHQAIRTSLGDQSYRVLCAYLKVA